MKKLIVIIILLFSFTSKSEEFSKPEKIGELSFQLVNFLDMMQTIEIVQHDDLYYETNPILGKHPQQHEVITYFMLRGYAHYRVTQWLPEKFRMPWLTISVLPQIPILEHNHNLGIRVTF